MSNLKLIATKKTLCAGNIKYKFMFKGQNNNVEWIITESIESNTYTSKQQ